MWTARVGTSGARGATGMLVRTPREFPARLTARTLTAPGGRRGKPTENVPSGATSTGASSTVTVDASFTRPVRATGAPRTAGRVGPVISMRGRTRSTVKVQSRWARPGHEGLVDGERQAVRAVGEVARAVGERAVGDVRLVEHVGAVVLERGRVHQARQVGGDAEPEVLGGRGTQVGVGGGARGGQLQAGVAQRVPAHPAEDQGPGGDHPPLQPGVAAARRAAARRARAAGAKRLAFSCSLLALTHALRRGAGRAPGEWGWASQARLAEPGRAGQRRGPPRDHQGTAATTRSRPSSLAR